MKYLFSYSINDGFKIFPNAVTPQKVIVSFTNLEMPVIQFTTKLNKILTNIDSKPFGKIELEGDLKGNIFYTAFEPEILIKMIERQMKLQITLK